MSANASDLKIWQDDKGKPTHVAFDGGAPVPIVSCQPAMIPGGMAWMIAVRQGAVEIVAGPPPAPALDA